MKKMCFFLLSALCYFSLSAQVELVPSTEKTEIVQEKTEFQLMEDTLAILSYAIVNDSLEMNRFAACKKFIPNLVKALKTPNSFDQPFDRLKTISILYPRDSSFRVFTWQLYVNENDYRYYGAIQMNSPELQLHALIDRSHEVEDTEYEILSSQKWYGALYYNILDFESEEGTKYLLFGFDGSSFFNKRKVVDVLSFEKQKPLFGSPVFAEPSEGRPPLLKNRLVVNYSSEASSKLNYDEFLNAIVMDNLMAFGETIDGPRMVPDGSYKGYQLQAGKWILIEKLFTQTQEKPPMPAPVLGKERKKRKDLFGNR